MLRSDVRKSVLFVVLKTNGSNKKDVRNLDSSHKEHTHTHTHLFIDIIMISKINQLQYKLKLPWWLRW